MAVGLIAGLSSIAAAHTAKPKPLEVKSISPEHGPLGGGTLVTVTGKDFGSATAVDFGAGNPATFAPKTTNVLVATAPSGTGTVDVMVTVGGVTTTDTPADEFTYTSLPTIQSVIPHVGATTGFTKVTISGAGFPTTPDAVTAVQFGGAEAQSFTVNSSQSITALTPANSTPGAYPVEVFTTSGDTPSDPAAQFTYAVRAPIVNGIEPSSGTAGTTVDVLGSRFMKKGTTVDFGSNPATVQSIKGTEIVCTAPTGSGTVDVTVTDSKGTSSVSSADEFTYSSPES